MGVPSFFRWLADKYPYILDDVIEEKTPGQYHKCIVSPPEAVAKQPNSGVTLDKFGNVTQELAIDNLYLDCNGIIHPCCHPESGPKPKSEAEMMLNVGLYIDRLFNAIQPRKLLYLAIDGVAPRAKMNQQRSRRFCSAREAQELKAAEEDVRNALMSQNRPPPPEKKPSWDHNVITPGTEFMSKLATYLRSYVDERITNARNDSKWASVVVIISDATVPGEGEHKIMEFIRAQKRLDTYDPNTSHCICGQDADLMMLGLALHEPRVTILRELVVSTRKHKKHANATQDGSKYFLTHPMQLLHVNRMREYLRKDLQVDELNLEFERVVDDFVLICFFVGNDFLPHIQSLSINEGALDLLMIIYKSSFHLFGGYLSCQGSIFPDKIEKFMAIVGALEFEVFRSQQRGATQREKARKEKEQKKKENDEQKKQRIADLKAQQSFKRAERQAKQGLEHQRNFMAEMGIPDMSVFGIEVEDELLQETLFIQAQNELRDARQAAAATSTAESASSGTEPGAMMRKLSQKTAAEYGLNPLNEDGQDACYFVFGSDSDEEYSDEEDASLFYPPEEIQMSQVTPEEYETLVQAAVAEAATKLPNLVGGDPELHAKGWQERYYAMKLKENDSKLERARMVFEFVRGMAWVMHYYYQGVASWDWYYPFHYAPLAASFKGLSHINLKFELGTPFPPIAQLMSVLPAESGSCLPLACRELMVNDRSPIRQYYPQLTGPKAFPLDPNGMPPHLRWRWIAVLPFIDANTLLQTLRAVEPTFTAEEKARNSRGRVEMKVRLDPTKSPTALNIVTCKTYKMPSARPEMLPGQVMFDVKVVSDSSKLSPEEQVSESFDQVAISNQVETCYFELDPRTSLHKSAFKQGGSPLSQHSVPNDETQLKTKAPRLPVPPQVLQRVFQVMKVKLPDSIQAKIEKQRKGKTETGHSISRSAVAKSKRQCRYGGDCRSKQCSFTHPGQSSAVKSDAKPAVRHHDVHSSANKSAQKPPCRYGASCNRSNCKFLHKKALPTQCKFGLGCKRDGCKFRHPE